MSGTDDSSAPRLHLVFTPAREPFMSAMAPVPDPSDRPHTCRGTTKRTHRRCTRPMGSQQLRVLQQTCRYAGKGALAVECESSRTFDGSVFRFYCSEHLDQCRFEDFEVEMDPEEFRAMWNENQGVDGTADIEGQPVEHFEQLLADLSEPAERDLEGGVDSLIGQAVETENALGPEYFHIQSPVQDVAVTYQDESSDNVDPAHDAEADEIFCDALEHLYITDPTDEERDDDDPEAFYRSASSFTSSNITTPSYPTLPEIYDRSFETSTPDYLSPSTATSRSSNFTSENSIPQRQGSDFEARVLAAIASLEGTAAQNSRAISGLSSQMSGLALLIDGLKRTLAVQSLDPRISGYHGQTERPDSAVLSAETRIAAY